MLNLDDDPRAIHPKALAGGQWYANKPTKSKQRINKSSISEIAPYRILTLLGKRRQLRPALRANPRHVAHIYGCTHTMSRVAGHHRAGRVASPSTRHLDAITKGEIGGANRLNQRLCIATTVTGSYQTRDRPRALPGSHAKREVNGKKGMRIGFYLAVVEVQLQAVRIKRHQLLGAPMGKLA